MGKWQKGMPSPNPSGRPRGFKGLAAYIRTQTNDAKELADFALSVFRNEEKTYTHTHQWDAMCWLADRALGKAVATTIELGADTHNLQDLPDVSGLDPDQLLELDQTIENIISKAAAKVKEHV